MPSTPEQETILVLQRLLEQTERGRLRWASVDSDYEFEADAGSSHFLMECKDRDDAHPYNLYIARDGKHLSTISTVSSTAGDGEEHNRAILALYRAVKRAAMSLGHAAEDVLKDLDGLG